MILKEFTRVSDIFALMPNTRTNTMTTIISNNQHHNHNRSFG